MQRVELKDVEHKIKIGEPCPTIEPNVTEDTVFYADGKPVGFYLKQMPEKMRRLADLADAEFRSERVPKSNMNRADTVMLFKEHGANAKNIGVSQFSTILGSIPPKPLVRRNYASRSSVHGNKKASTFVKAMLMLARESEQLLKEIMPEQYEAQKALLEGVDKKWRFANLFTGSISNFNISAKYHRDAGNIVGAVNVIICKKRNSTGGDLNIPDYGVTVGQQDNSILVYPAWRNVHGVTPIIPTHPEGYRNSLVFYPIKAFIGLK